jgi:hypothetical protein
MVVAASNVAVHPRRHYRTLCNISTVNWNRFMKHERRLRRQCTVLVPFEGESRNGVIRNTKGWYEKQHSFNQGKSAFDGHDLQAKSWHNLEAVMPSVAESNPPVLGTKRFIANKCHNCARVAALAIQKSL